MRNLYLFMAFGAAIALIVISCKKKDDPTPDDKTTIVKNYAGSGSEGDLITFNINQTDKTYVVDNETTGKTESGSYSILTDPALKGIYQVNASGSTFYGVELNDRIIAANFPTGNPLNTISFGVSSQLDNTNNLANISGDYIFITMSNKGIMNDPNIKEWGILNINSDKSWKKKNFASNTGDGSVTDMSPELYSGALSISNADESGTWEVNGTHKERLKVKINGVTTEPSGYVYATANEGAFLLDLGTGNGFLLGLKITTNATLNNISGDYKYINVWDNGKGAGNYSIDNNGKLTWTHIGSDGNSTGNFQLNQCSNVFKNVFYANKVLIETNYYEDIYCVIIGDIMMHFSFDDSNGDFASYGVGAKLD